MRSKTKIIVGILVFTWIFGLFFSFIPVRAKEEYQLTFTEGTTLIYEYTKIDKDLLKELADSTGVEEYKDLAEINEGDQFKMVIATIKEEDDRWVVAVESYKGKNFEDRAEDIEVKVYKDPGDLKDKIFEKEEDDQSSLYFFPVDVETYLGSFEESAIEDDRYYDADYEIYVDDTKLTFDYTISGYSDAIEQAYTKDGILEELTILCDGEDAFKRELIKISQDSVNIFYGMIVAIISISALSSIIGVYVSRKKKYLASDPEKKVNKLLNEAIRL